MKNFLKHARPFLVSLCVAVVFLAVFFIITAITGDIEPQPAPDITGVAYDETSLYSLSENFGEHGTVLVFVDPMIEEDLLYLAKLMVLDISGEQVVAVSISDQPFAAQKTEIERLAVESVRFVFDTDGEMAKTYGISGSPVTYFIDKNGMILDAHLGHINTKTLEKSFAAIA